MKIFAPIATVLAVVLVTGCSSSESASVPEDAAPSTVYRDAVCGSGQERVAFAMLAQGYQQGQGIQAAQVIDAAGRAASATQRAVEMLQSPNVSWPDAVLEDVGKVRASEEAIAGDLAPVANADEAGLDAALDTFFARPGTSDGAGERVRSELGLGEPGDCPVSPASERAFIALIQRYAPTVYSQGDEAVLALGREACVILRLNLSEADELEQVKALGLSETQAAVVMESAPDYVCDSPATSLGASDTASAVDAVLDQMIEGTLILTQRSPESRTETVVQFEDARAKWATAAELLEAGIPGVPADISSAVLLAFDRSLAAMDDVITCVQSSTSAPCTSEIDANSRLSNALGQELATLIPYGSRTGEEVIEALNGGGSATANGGFSSGGTGPETVSQSNARQKAEQYLAFSAFSRQGLVDQLIYEGFSTSDATYGADAVGANWNEQAALKAQQYLDFTAFSRSGLIDQLVFDGFSLPEATYGANAVGL